MNCNEFLELGYILVLLLPLVSSDLVLFCLVLLELREVTSPVGQLFTLQVDHLSADSIQEVSSMRHDNNSSVC